MPVLERSALEASPLADLHVLARELGIDGFRRLRKADLVNAILARQAGEELPVVTSDAEAGVNGDPAPVADADADADADAESAGEDAPLSDGVTDEDEGGRRPRRGRRGGRSRSRTRDDDSGNGGESEPAAAEAPAPNGDAEAGQTAEGVVELLANGSGFVRLGSPGVTDGDVYISAAQVKRCELVAGDRVSGPVRKPRQSERFPSLVRVETINGRPSDEVAEGTRFEERAAAYPTQPLEFGEEDKTLAAIEKLAPFGLGSRVTIAGPARSGKTEALRRIALSAGRREDLELVVVLAGIRPEEISDWSVEGLPARVACEPLGASADAQLQAAEQACEQGRRVAARGGNAVVVIDTLTYVAPSAVRRLLASARNLTEGGSLTIVATVAEPVGGETTVIGLDAVKAAAGDYPALDPARTGTLRAELLVGEDRAKAIAKKRSKAID